MDAPPGSEPLDSAPSRNDYLIWLEHKAALLAAAFWQYQPLYVHAPAVFGDFAPVQVNVLQTDFQEFQDRWQPHLLKRPAAITRTELDQTPVNGTGRQFVVEFETFLDRQRATVAEMQRAASAESVRQDDYIDWLGQLQAAFAAVRPVLESTLAVQIPPEAPPSVPVAMPGQQEPLNELWTRLAPAALAMSQLAEQVRSAAAEHASDAPDSMPVISKSLDEAAACLRQAVEAKEVDTAFESVAQARASAEGVLAFVVNEQEHVDAALSRHRAELTRLAPARAQVHLTEKLGAVLRYLVDSGRLNWQRADSARSIAAQSAALFSLIDSPDDERTCAEAAKKCERIRDEFLRLIHESPTGCADQGVGRPRKRQHEDPGDPRSSPGGAHGFDDDADRPAKRARAEQPDRDPHRLGSPGRDAHRPAKRARAEQPDRDPHRLGSPGRDAHRPAKRARAEQPDRDPHRLGSPGRDEA